MRKIGGLLIILVWVFSSCEKKTEPKYSGEFLLSSELMQSGQSYSYYGFTFEDGKISVYPPNSSLQPDLAAIHLIFNQNITITLESSNKLDAFYNNGDFPNSSEAEAYYNNYTEVTADVLDFQDIALDIQINQVWTIQTAGEKFAKIWIKDMQTKTGPLSDYVELTIQYHYQPDGSKIFPN
jgi:hypothetical protein